MIKIDMNLNKVYEIIEHIPYLRQQIIKIKFHAIQESCQIESYARAKAARSISTLLLLLLLLSSFVFILTGSVGLLVMTLLIGIVTMEHVTDFFIELASNKLLAGQIQFNDLLRLKYHESGMVDMAVEEALELLDRKNQAMKAQGIRFHEVLMASNPREAMASYNDQAPNEFLSILLGLMYMTMEYGDSHENGSSVFLTNLKDLTNEIRLEWQKRDQLNYALKSLNVIVLLPLVFMWPIKGWASVNFPPMMTFYESGMGYLFQVAMVMIVLLSYIFLQKVQRSQSVKSGRTKVPIAVRIFYSKWRKIFQPFFPASSSAGHFRIKRKLSGAGSPLSVETMIINQILTMLSLLVVTAILITNWHFVEKHNILGGPTLPESFIGGQLDDDTFKAALDRTTTDNIYLEMIDSTWQIKDIQALLEDNKIYGDEARIMAQRLFDKKIRLINMGFHWWQFVLIFLAMIIGYQLPWLLLSFSQKITALEKEEEVAGFNNILLMLMHHKGLTVLDLIEWLVLYAHHFKDALMVCEQDASGGIYDALEAMKSASASQGFHRMIDGLMMASKDLSIQEAFDELASEKAYYLELHKRSNERIIEKKINLGQMLGFLPIYSLLLIYMVVPMVITSMADMEQYFNLIK